MTDLQPDTERQADQETTEALRELIARELTGARERTSLLTDCVDEADLIRQHSPLMSPLVWDLAHIANQEELWLLREVGGREPLHPEIDPLYDAFEHPRSERPTLPLLPPAQARASGPERGGWGGGSWTCSTGPGSAAPDSAAPDSAAPGRTPGSVTCSGSGWSPSMRCSTTRPC